MYETRVEHFVDSDRRYPSRQSIVLRSAEPKDVALLPQMRLVRKKAYGEALQSWGQGLQARWLGVSEERFGTEGGEGRSGMCRGHQGAVETGRCRAIGVQKRAATRVDADR